jgi:hypothetical protein
VEAYEGDVGKTGAYVNRRTALPERNQRGGEVLMQLADETVVASGPATWKCLSEARIDNPRSRRRR